MMQKKIVFRADGNAKTGLGHLFRIFALTEMVKDTFEYVLLTKNDSTLSVIPTDYSFELIPDEISLNGEPEWLSKKYNPLETIVLADGYQFNSGYQKKIKEQGFKLVYVDDLAKEHMYADVVINHSPIIKPEDFKSETYTNFALGTDYAILRPSFLEAAKRIRTIGKIDTAFVCFGGADPYDLTYKSVKALLAVSDLERIHVVLGGAYPHSDIYAIEKNHPNVKIHKNLNEDKLIALMYDCNMAIVPASTILYEVCTVKMPVLSGFFVDNQKSIYSGFLSNNLIYKAGDFTQQKEEDLKNIIKNILMETNFESIITAQGRLFNDKIVFRHIENLKKLC